MDLSEAARDGGSDEATRVDRRDQRRCLVPNRCASSVSDGRTAVRPAQISNHEPLEQCYNGFLEFDESEEVVKRQAMNFTITTDAAILMPNDTPNAESKLAETYNVEATTVDEIRNRTSGLACLTRRVD